MRYSHRYIVEDVVSISPDAVGILRKFVSNGQKARYCYNKVTDYVNGEKKEKFEVVTVVLKYDSDSNISHIKKAGFVDYVDQVKHIKEGDEFYVIGMGDSEVGIKCRLVKHEKLNNNDYAWPGDAATALN